MEINKRNKRQLNRNISATQLSSVCFKIKTSISFPGHINDYLTVNDNFVLTILMVSIIGEDLAALSLAASMALWKKKQIMLI